MQMSEKLGERADPAIIQWLQQAAVNPQPEAIPRVSSGSRACNTVHGIIPL